ncbi:MAG: DUF554 domain-containing protein [Clostridia bacterium]|nr:DUF554 domain-containing protein [Clostridia bacterium]
MGTIVNIIAVLAGSIIGMVFKRGISDKLSESLMKALGLATVFIGITGVLSDTVTVIDGRLSVSGVLLMIVSLTVGTLAGEAMRIEERLEGLGEKLKKLKIFASGGERFTEGLVTAFLVFCVGAMSIVGPIKDALYGDASILFTKSVLDLTSSMIFASALGVGVMCAVIPLAVYQGALTLFAGLVEPYLYTLGDGRLVSNLSAVGSVLIFGVGINLIFGKRLRVGNMLPALIVPVIYAICQSITVLLK